MTKTFLSPIYLESLIDSFFNAGEVFRPTDILNKIQWPAYPANIFIKDETLVFEIAANGKEKQSIKVSSEDRLLKIDIDDDLEEDRDKEYICHKMVKKGVSLEYSVPDKFDLSKTKVNLSKGILKVEIPIAEEAKKKNLTFEVK